MLNLNDVKFPIKFTSKEHGEITFKSKDTGEFGDGKKLLVLKLEWLIELNHMRNPDNSPENDFYYEMGVSDKK
ncbi:TPA: hypothetical protein ACWSVR_004445 [Escherichia coli]